MGIQISDILKTLEQLAPSHLAEQWDNVGLLVGSRHSRVSSILIGLDATNQLVDEAVSCGADTIITHHPVIFKPLASIRTDSPAGRLLQNALTNDITIIGCHTNFDSAENGVNDVLARQLGLKELTALQPSSADTPHLGLGRIGKLTAPISRSDFIGKLLEILKLETLTLAGPMPETISTVALCGGSGSEFAPLAQSKGADVYISAEIKHSTAVWANEAGFAVIDGTHYATEKPATYALAEILQEIAANNGWQIDIHCSRTEHHPLVHVSRNSFLNNN